MSGNEVEHHKFLFTLDGQLVEQHFRLKISKINLITLVDFFCI